MNLALMAFRNLRRAKARTTLKVLGLGTTAAVMLVWGSLTRGFCALLQQTATTTWTGEIQIHHPKFRTTRDLFAVIEDPRLNVEYFRRLGFDASPRLYSAAMAAAADRSLGVDLRGLDWQMEARITRLHKQVDRGRWLGRARPNEAVIGPGIAKSLAIDVGSELAIVVQAADGSLGNELLHVVGILKAVDDDLDRRAVFVDELPFRQLLALPVGVHEWVLTRADPLEELAQARERLADLSHEVVTWEDLKPLLARILGLLSVTTYITLFFTYASLGGLILNMLFMTIHDRRREYAVSLAVGMEPARLVGLILMEVFLLALAAGAAALLLGMPWALHLQNVGIDFRFIVDRLAFAGVSLEPIVYAQVGVRQIVAPIVFLLIMIPIFGVYPALEVATRPPGRGLSGA